MGTRKKVHLSRMNRKAFITAMLDRFIPKLPPLSNTRGTIPVQSQAR